MREAIRYGQVKRLIVTDPLSHQDLLDECISIPIYQADSSQARQLATTVTPQGIWAEVHSFHYEIEDLGQDISLILICSQVRDPGNAGTLIRCADAFGADGVIMTKGCVELTNPKLVRSSVGSIFHLPIVTDIEFDQAVNALHERGVRLCAADMSGIPLTEAATTFLADSPIGWVMGNEAWGIPDECQDALDEVVSIEMWGKAESLNVSTAAAICLYQSAVIRHGKSAFARSEIG